jgi:tRNA1Val (adenine37-N6)-methyltransferase
MANQWFQFKQFTIHQQHAAMKVTTDACLFGALQPVFENRGRGKRLLDIGAGTGLLSLMLAQMNPLSDITGVEIDLKTAEEAQANVNGSDFAETKIIHSDILDFEPDEFFDHIISNPPFYESQLTSENILKNMAHHSTTLTLESLFRTINSLLKPEGTSSVLIPHYREAEARYLALAHSLFAQKTIQVRQTPEHAYFRSIIFFSRKPANPETAEIIIRDENGRYTPEFTKLLKPFYLYL